MPKRWSEIRKEHHMHESQSASLAMPFLTLTAHPAIGAVLLDPRPAWVWNSEGSRILWANVAGVAFFGEPSMDALLNRTFGDVHPARRHLSRLARNARADTPVLDRLRFFLGDTAVTASCLCKRLDVQGEGVLLIMATDQPDAGHSDQVQRQLFLDMLVKDTDMQAVIFDNLGQTLAHSGSIDCLPLAPKQLQLMMTEADTPLRLAADTISHNDTQFIVALARIGEENVRHYLAIVQDADADQGIDTRALLFAELDDGVFDENAIEDTDNVADIFGNDFGLENTTPNTTNVTDLAKHLQNIEDVHPFLSDLPSVNPFLDRPHHYDDNVTVLKDRSKRTAPTKASLSSGASMPETPSNVVALPFGMDNTESDGIDDKATSENPAQSAQDVDATPPYEFDDDGGLYHFVWESDEVGRFNYISPDLAQAVGPDYADLIGLSWPEIADRFKMDQDGVVAKAFEARDTWAGLTVLWPIQGRTLRAPVELTGLPVFGRYHGFQGFRGFGVCNTKTLKSGIDPSTDAGIHAPTTPDAPTSPQFEGNSDLMSDELLLAARNAVVAAEETVSAGSSAADALHEEPMETLEQDGVDAVHDEVNDPSTAQKDPGDLAAQKAAEGGDGSRQQEDEPQTSHSGNDPYDLVSTLLSGSTKGVKESLLGDKDDDADQSATVIDTQSATDADPDGAGRSEALSDGERDAFDSIAAALTDGPFQDRDKQNDANLITSTSGADRANTSDIVTETPSKARPQMDETLRSAASSAFREILAMDPAFRHMRGHMAKLSEDKSEYSKDSSSTENTPSDTAPSTETTSPSETIPGEPPIVQDFEASEVADDAMLPSEVLPAEKGDEATASNDTQDANQIIAPTVEGTTDKVPRVDDADAETDAADMSNVEAETASLWDSKDSSSPLINLLDKLPTAIIVSAGSTILFASRKALRLLSFETSADLEKAGGMEGLFTGRPGDWLTKTDGRTTLRGGKGVPVSVLATISSINWGDRPAAMLSFEDAQETAPKTGVSEEDEKIAELEAILDAATDGVVVLDGDGMILRMNHSAEALFETDRHDVAGDSFLTLLAEESHNDTLTYLESLKSNGVASILNDGREIVGRVKSGGMLRLFMTMGRIAIPGTNRFGVVLRDIAQRKRAEELLLTQKLGAETASQQKSDMLAKVSHEIRTPLNAIIGFSEVMMDERFGAIGSTRYKDYLKDISISGKHIMNLLNDLLDLSKVEAGKMEMQFEPTQLNRLVSESVGLMQPQASRDQIIIRTSFGSNLPDVAGDDRSLRQIILNLLSNALKFTDTGGQVIVSTGYEESGDVVLRIRDTGIGMNEEELKIALEPFRQVSTTRSALQGTGLGLPLTKALVEANQFRFAMTSKKGYGTLVEVTIPKERVILKQDAGQ